jgi:hypothetical protein
MSRTPGLRRSPSSPADTRLPSPAAFPGGTRQGPGSLGWLWRLVLQHHALWGGARAGARCALAVGNPRCSTIALTPPAPFTYANTLKPASTPQAREHIQGERPFQQPGPVQTGCALLPRLLHRRGKGGALLLQPRLRPCLRPATFLRATICPILHGCIEQNQCHSKQSTQGVPCRLQPRQCCCACSLFVLCCLFTCSHQAHMPRRHVWIL